MKNIRLDSTHNTRDLANLKTKDGRAIKKKKLIRSGSLYKLTSHDIKVLKKYNVKIVIDFRSEKEFVNKADVRIDGITYINLPVLPKKETTKDESKHSDSNLLQLVDKKTGGFNMLLSTYENMFLTKEGINAYKEFFKILQSKHDGAILWHCSQGKDRAGMAAFLVEYALGVDINDCYKDYLFTNKAMELKIQELTPVVLLQSQHDLTLLPILKDVFTAKMEYLNKALESINNTYGGLDKLLVDVLEVDVEKLRKMYLD